MQRFSAAATALVVVLAGTAQAEPPFRDLPWIWPGIIEITDTGVASEVEYVGRRRRPFDEGWSRPSVGDGVIVNVFLYRAVYPGHQIEIYVHPEYNRRRGRTGEDITWEDPVRVYRGPAYDEETLRERRFAEVRYLADMIGRIPALMRERILVVTLDTGYSNVWANRGRREIRFHSRFNDKLESYGAAEEYLIHEAGHLLEDEYAATDCWREAQASDAEFISEYAASDPGSGVAGDWDGPGGEDFAETLVAYFGLRYRPGRLDAETSRTIRETIPARIACMDGWGFGVERPAE